MTHLKMQLSERENKLVKQILNEAYQEGGRELEFVTRKFIMTVYWYHMACIFEDAGGTVYHTLNRMLHRPVSSIKQNISVELFGYDIYSLKDSGIIFEDMMNDILNDNMSVYKGIKIKHIFDTRQSSLKPFMDSLRQVIDCGEYNKRRMKEIGLLYNKPALDEELPF